MAYLRGAREESPILIDDDEPSDVMVLDDPPNTAGDAAPSPIPYTFDVASTDSDDSLSEESDTTGLGRRARRIRTQRNPEVDRFMNRVDTYDPKGLNLHENVVVEVGVDEFLRIVHILQYTKTGEVFLRGHKFRRTRYMDGMLDSKLNEVCWIQELDEDDCRPAEVQSMVTFGIGEVVKRRKLRFTNQPYPNLSFRDDKGWIIPSKYSPDKVKMLNHITDNAPLTCRMKYVSYFRDSTERLRQNSHENAFVFLHQNECDAGIDNKVSDAELRRDWRGETELGGAQIGWGSGEKEFLRQEALSHVGKTCYNSLTISGRQYEPGDVMERGTVGELLIRDDEAGAIYTKLSGVNDSCFVRTKLNVVTGDEFHDLEEDDKELNQRLRDVLRGTIETGGALYMNDQTRRPDARPSSVLTKEVIEIDAHRRKRSKDFVRELRAEGSITTKDSVRDQQSRKRNMSLSFPMEQVSGRKRTSGQSQKEGNSHTSIFTRPKVPLDTSPTKSKPPHRRYTFGDCFCGAGGMSRAAVSAGLRVKWGFDFNDLACYTYALNFHSARVYHEDAHSFATSIADQKVDICHMSPPCQYFSPAHTHVGKNDEANTAAFFAVGQLLTKTRCRVAILEQTAGLLNRHEQYFNASVREFAQRGFSVRWKLINGADLGLPQRRTRLFMIASCPGEPLPPFPTPTHTAHPSATTPHLKPWTTINAAIANIPRDWPNHSPHLLPRRSDPPPPPGAGDRVANCITTSGGDNTLHPAGGRSFTQRELACLQKFPMGHKFGGVEVRSQIGNAVSPLVGERVLEEVVKSLREADGVV